MQNELKPTSELGPKKKKKKKETEPREKSKFGMKKHKRKNKHGEEILVSAIHDNSTGKQVAQLSSNTNSDCENIVAKMVANLNNQSKSLDDVIQELNAFKASSA